MASSEPTAPALAAAERTVDAPGARLHVRTAGAAAEVVIQFLERTSKEGP